MMWRRKLVVGEEGDVAADVVVAAAFAKVVAAFVATAATGVRAASLPDASVVEESEERGCAADAVMAGSKVPGIVINRLAPAA
jgi:hypothetical protein